MSVCFVRDVVSQRTLRQPCSVGVACACVLHECCSGFTIISFAVAPQTSVSLKRDILANLFHLFIINTVVHKDNRLHVTA